MHGFHGGDAEGEAHGGVGGGPAPLAVDVFAVAEIDDVVDDEEVSGEIEFLDDGELFGNLLPRPVFDLLRSAPVPLRRSLIDE